MKTQYPCVGRLTKDAEQRFTTGGKPVLNFTLAQDVGYGDNKSTNYWNCSIWGKRAEGKLVEHLKKGTKLFVTGEVILRQYEHEGASRISPDLNIADLEIVYADNKDASGDKSHDSDPFAA